MDSHIVAMDKTHAAAAAELHRLGIPEGFLTSLGTQFLRQLYKAIPSCPAGFGFVWRREERICGFVTCATSTSALYKQALIRRGLCMAPTLLRFALRPSTLRRIWQTVRYPAAIESGDLPGAELLSIAVSEECRGQGIGGSLLDAARQELARRGIAAFRVAVGASLPSNAFYQGHGFRLARTIVHHGQPANIYVSATG